MGINMKFSLEVLADYLLVIRATDETGEFTSFYIKDLKAVMLRIIQEKEDINNISKDLFKVLIANNLVEYNSRNVMFLVR